MFTWQKKLRASTLYALYLFENANNTLKDKAAEEIKEKQAREKSEKLIGEFEIIIGKITTKQDVESFLSYLLQCNSDPASGSGPKVRRAVKGKLDKLETSKFIDGTNRFFCVYFLIISYIGILLPALIFNTLFKLPTRAMRGG